MRQKTRPTTERFWEKVAKRGPDECWEWTGARQHNGYGYLHCGGHTQRKPLRSHRASWEMHNGPIPKGLWVLHKCDNPPCVNPAHLFLGDRKANMDDCAVKGRVSTIGKSEVTHCVNGHPYSEENTEPNWKGGRQCKICRQGQRDRRNQKYRAKAAAIRAGKKG